MFDADTPRHYAPDGSMSRHSTRRCSELSERIAGVRAERAGRTRGVASRRRHLQMTTAISLLTRLTPGADQAVL